MYTLVDNLYPQKYTIVYVTMYLDVKINRRIFYQGLFFRANVILSDIAWYLRI